MELKKINLSEIVCDSNRKYTKDDGFEQLLNSIREYGIIEPPVVRLQGGEYRVVAGRRRIEAARRLELAAVGCMVMETDDPLNDEEIALSENVNRLEMHPLDEAAVFRRMNDGGSSVEEIARYYARSPSAIYKRLRLVPLIDELKTWFRDRFLNICGAAVLAELPEEDQRAFVEQHQNYVDVHSTEECQDVIWGGDEWEISNEAIITFVHKRQRFKIPICFEDECQACAKRTHNSGNDLFEEYDHLDDVCLDGDCYRVKWHKAIEFALQEKDVELAHKGPHQTDKKIVFVSGGKDGVLKQLYKQATHIEFGGERLEVLKEKDWNFTGDTERKKGACWAVSEKQNGLIEVLRVGYTKKKPEEKPAKVEKGKTDNSILNNCFGKEAAAEFAAARGMGGPAELEKMLGDQECRFNMANITSRVYERVVENRIEKERTGEEPVSDYFNMYLEFRGINFSNLLEKDIRFFRSLTGKESALKLGLNMTDETQKVFHFLLIGDEDGYGDTLDDSVPTLDDVTIGNLADQEKLFMKYSGLDKGAYKELWMRCAGEVMDEIMKPNPKKGGKKETVKKGAAPHGGDGDTDASSDDTPAEDEDEDNYPFEPDDDEEA